MEALLVSTSIVALAAQYQSLAAVVAGTTLGMMIANVPAVLLGDQLAEGCRCASGTSSRQRASPSWASPRCWERRSSSSCDRGEQRP